MKDLIEVTIIDKDGTSNTLQIPTGISLSLMEVLKGEGYPILATCGGMALCATCHVQVIKGYEKLHQPEDQEWAMLDTLPNYTPQSRLSCQLKIDETMDGMEFRVMGEDNV
ncbi:MAG: 2Fe-2S iron-sulfur cluster-binding protein [Flavobacteriales bacterium]|nr:2Fe-2S iron-sulfur cluster-binding protein [Flavobacteriales bacterium]